MYSLDDDFVDSHGLVNSRTDEKNGENSILWTIELFFLMKEKGQDTSLIESSIDTALKEMRIGPGLYKQNPSYVHPKEDPTHEAYMSHDQLTSILCYSRATGDQQAIEDVISAFSKLFIYDNKNPESPSIKRIFHPQDMGYYYMLSNKLSNRILGLVLCPVLLLSTIYTFLKKEKCRNGQCFPKTDREIIYYVKQSAYKQIFTPINWLCQLRIKQRFGSWAKVWSTYFKNLNHPINKIQ